MKTIRLTGKKQADYASKLINECLDKPELWCVDIKPFKEAKTLQQLRALFGTWYDYLSDTLGETKDDLHWCHKIGRNGVGGWLIDIYNESPEGDSQIMWVELYNQKFQKYGGIVGCKQVMDYDMKGLVDLLTHRSRISLSWATIDQMREYMKRIEHYYMNAGFPLPILEKFTRYYQ